MKSYGRVGWAARHATRTAGSGMLLVLVIPKIPYRKQPAKPAETGLFPCRLAVAANGMRLAWSCRGAHFDLGLSFQNDAIEPLGEQTVLAPNREIWIGGRGKQFDAETREITDRSWEL
jgi:hypothetical protein